MRIKCFTVHWVFILVSFTLHNDDSTMGLRAGGGLNWILPSSYIVISLPDENFIVSK